MKDTDSYSKNEDDKNKIDNDYIFSKDNVNILNPEIEKF